MHDGVFGDAVTMDAIDNGSTWTDSSARALDHGLDAQVLLELLEASGDGLALIDTERGTYLHLNAAARRTLADGPDAQVGSRAPWPIRLGGGRLATKIAGRDYTYTASGIQSAGRGLVAIQFRDVTGERRREERLRAFSIAAANLAFADNLTTALDRLAEQVRRTADMSSCTFLLYDAHGRVRQAGASGRYPHDPEYLARLIESRTLGAPLLSDEVMRTGRPQVAHGWHDRMLTDPRFAPMRVFTEKSDWDTIVVIPLISRGEPVGVFNGFYRTGTEPEGEDLTFLQSVADQAAIAVDMFALRDRAQREAAREERGKLARDLHDSVSQMLFSLNLQAAAAESAASGSAVAAPLHEIRELSSEAFAVMRQIILGTRPVEFDGGRDLVAAVREHVAALGQHTQISVSVIAPDAPIELPGEMQEQLLRVVQEALHNAIRHAPHTPVTVRLELDGRKPELTIEVTDAGGGFDPGIPRPGRLGVTGMAERIHKLGGRLDIESGNEGTVVRASVPVESTLGGGQ